MGHPPRLTLIYEALNDVCVSHIAAGRASPLEALSFRSILGLALAVNVLFANIAS